MVEILYREALRLGIDEALEKDPNVFIMGEDIGAYGGAYAVTDGLLDKYGPKKIVTSFLLVALIGIISFALAKKVNRERTPNASVDLPI